MILAILLLIGFTSSTVYADDYQPAEAEEVVVVQTPAEIIYDAAARYGQSGTRMLNVVKCESQNFTRVEGDYVRGRPTSHGYTQLHEGGLLGSFYAMGYTNPYDLLQAADFMAYEWSIGNRRHWHCPG